MSSFHPTIIIPVIEEKTKAQGHTTVRSSQVNLTQKPRLLNLQDSAVSRGAVLVPYTIPRALAIGKSLLLWSPKSLFISNMMFI